MSITALNWAFAQNIEPSAKKFVLVALADIADDYGICFPSYKTISNKTNISTRTVMRHVDDLIKDGFLSKSNRLRYNGSQSTNIYTLSVGLSIPEDHPLNDGGVILSPPPVTICHPPSDTVSPLLTTNITIKEKKALTRDEFLRVIDGGYQDGAFAQWEHLTETEIKAAAESCLDFYGAKGQWPDGDPLCVVRYWIRKGIKGGAIRKAPSAQEQQTVLQGEPMAEPENPLQDWHERIRPLVPNAEFRSWLRKLWYDGHNHLCAPTLFHAREVQNRYRDEINAVLKGVEIIHKPYQPQPQKEAVYA